MSTFDQTAAGYFAILESISRLLEWHRDGSELYKTQEV